MPTGGVERHEPIAVDGRGPKGGASAADQFDRHHTPPRRAFELGGVLDPSVERFKLVALERPRLGSVRELDDDAGVLHVSDPKSPIGTRRDERRTRGEVVELLEKRVPAGGERHIQWLRAIPTKSWSRRGH